jgi:hypothetical protein
VVTCHCQCCVRPRTHNSHDNKVYDDDDGGNEDSGKEGRIDDSDDRGKEGRKKKACEDDGERETASASAVAVLINDVVQKEKEGGYFFVGKGVYRLFSCCSILTLKYCYCHSLLHDFFLACFCLFLWFHCL